LQKMNFKPRIALLSYSNFGSSEEAGPHMVREAVAMLHERQPDLLVDGEVQGNFAVNKQMLRDNFPFCKFVDEGANTLIFPNLDAGNITYKLLQELGGAEAIGPVLLGMKKPVHILQLGSSVREIVNMV